MEQCNRAAEGISVRAALPKTQGSGACQAPDLGGIAYKPLFRVVQGCLCDLRGHPQRNHDNKVSYVYIATLVPVVTKDLLVFVVNFVTERTPRFLTHYNTLAYLFTLVILTRLACPHSKNPTLDRTPCGAVHNTFVYITGTTVARLGTPVIASRSTYSLYFQI